MTCCDTKNPPVQSSGRTCRLLSPWRASCSLRHWQHTEHLRPPQLSCATLTAAPQRWGRSRRSPGGCRPAVSAWSRLWPASSPLAHGRPSAGPCYPNGGPTGPQPFQGTLAKENATSDSVGVWYRAQLANLIVITPSANSNWLGPHTCGTAAWSTLSKQPAPLLRATSRPAGTGNPAELHRQKLNRSPVLLHCTAEILQRTQERPWRGNWRLCDSAQFARMRLTP